MLVSVIVGNCPGCGAEGAYGNVSVGRDSLLRGCKRCKYSETIHLPEINKKIIYLDQFFISSAFKGKDERFVKSAEAVSSLCEKQLLVAPFSSVHEDETHQWRGYDQKGKDDLMAFVKSSSRGHEFTPAYEVEKTQILKQFASYLGGGDPEYCFEESDVFHKNVHDWDDYLWIDVGRYMGDVEQIRALKLQAITALVDCFDGWRETNSTFQNDVSLEISQASRNYISSYFEYSSRLARGDYNALLDSPIISTYVQSMFHYFPKDHDPDESVRKIAGYFASPHFENVPCVQISARMYAAFKAIVKGGAYRDRERALKELSGIFYDIKHISTYAPYCDAFVMDNAMASIASDRRVDLEGKFGTKIFSLNTWAEFADWMAGVENSASEEHQWAINLVYPGRF